MRKLSLLSLLGLMAALWACAQVSMPEPPEGRAIFAENCVQCHGVSGRGDGPFAASMSPRPADLTRLSENGVFPTARVLSVIDGYHRAALLGQEMPEFGLLLKGDTVPVDTADGVLTPVPRPLAALLVYLESIQAI